MTNFIDRSTAFLFGDGAGAVVIGPSEVPAIGPAIWGSDGEAADVIYTDLWNDALKTGESPVIHMRATRSSAGPPPSSRRRPPKRWKPPGWPPRTWTFIPHQANNRITDLMLRRMKLPEPPSAGMTG